MHISEVQIIPLKPKDGLVGFANIVIDNSIFLSSIGIYTRPEGGYRLTYPTKGSGGLNIFHPINKEAGDQLEKAIVSKFEEVISK